MRIAKMFKLNLEGFKDSLKSIAMESSKCELSSIIYIILATDHPKIRITRTIIATNVTN